MAATKLATGHTVEHVEGKELKDIQETFTGYDFGIVRLNPGRYFMLKPFLRYAPDIYNFKLHPADVFVLTYPKVGTTWTQEIVWTMRNNPDLDNPTASYPINTRCPFIESDMLVDSKKAPKPNPESEYMKTLMKMVPNLDFTRGVAIQQAESLPKPRTIKTHLPISMMPSNLLDVAKVIYVYRNPKDVVVSFMHHHRLFKAHGFVGTDEQFVDYFIKGDLLYGCYSEHLKEVAKVVNHPNILLLNFEDMKRDIAKEIKKMDAFLGTKLTEEQIENVIKHTSFEAMKKRDNLVCNNNELDMFDEKVRSADGGFFRAGQSGNFKKKLTPELDDKISNWAKEKCGDLEHFQFNYE